MNYIILYKDVLLCQMYIIIKNVLHSSICISNVILYLFYSTSKLNTFSNSFTHHLCTELFITSVFLTSFNISSTLHFALTFHHLMIHSLVTTGTIKFEKEADQTSFELNLTFINM